MKVLPKLLAKLAGAITELNVDYYVEKFCERTEIYAGELGLIRDRLWVFLPAPLGSDKLRTHKFESLEDFLLWRVEHPTNKKEIIICLFEDRTEAVDDLLRRLGDRCPKLFSPDPVCVHPNKIIGGFRTYENGVQPTIFYSSEDFVPSRFLPDRWGYPYNRKPYSGKIEQTQRFWDSVGRLTRLLQSYGFKLHPDNRWSITDDGVVAMLLQD